MSARPAGNHHPLVLRQTGAVVVPLAVWAFCLFAVGDAVVEGSPAYAVRTVLVTASVALAVWVVLYSPRLEVTRGGLRVVNPLRVHDVPYAALESVRVRGLTSLTFRAADDRLRTVSSWNAPGVPRRMVAETPPTTAAIERFRGAWERSGAPDRERGRTATTTWRRTEAALLGALFLVDFVIWLL